MTAARGSRPGFLPWRGVWRQTRSDLAPMVVALVVVAASTFLAAVVPQTLEAVATATVQAAVSDPREPADVVVDVRLNSGYGINPDAASAAAATGALIDAGMPPALRAVLGESVTAFIGPELKAGSIAGRPGRVRFVYLARGSGPGVTWVQGAAPAASGELFDVAEGDVRPPVEVALSQAVADVMGAHVGDHLEVQSPQGASIDVHVTGVYRPLDPADGAWSVAPTLLTPQLVDGSASQASIGLRVSAQSLPFAQLACLPSDMSQTFTYPVIASRVNATNAAELETQVRGLASGRKTFDIRGTQPAVETGLDRALHAALGRVATASAQAAVLLIGLLMAALLVEFLVAGLVVERRSAVLRQWRLRGAPLWVIGLANLVESVGIVVVAGILGILAAALVAGGSPPLAWVTIPLAAALVPQPLLAVRAAAGVDGSPRRSGARRITAEAALALLAVGALATLVVRGVSASAGAVWSDVVVLAAPVLVALAVALGLVRAQPWAARWVRRIAARGGGTVVLLAATRVRARALATSALVVAAAVAAIAATVAGTVSHGRLDASWDVMGADVSVNSYAPDGLPPAVAALDGADLRVATGTLIPGAQFLGPRIDRPVTVFAVDSAALARMLLASPSPDYAALAALATTRTGGVVALTSGVPAADEATLRWGDERITVRTVGEATGLPQALGLGDVPALVVDSAALAEALGHPVPASRAWVVGPGAAARVEAALAGTRAEVVRRDAWIAAQASAPLPRALGWLFAGSTVVALGLAVLAVALMAASGTAERTRAAAQLRVLGMSRRDAARIGWLDAMAVAALATVVGLAVGAAVSAPLVAALDLRTVTGGRENPALVPAWWALAIPVLIALVTRVSVAVAGRRGQGVALGSLIRR